jgi:hypothetical protein
VPSAKAEPDASNDSPRAKAAATGRERRDESDFAIMAASLSVFAGASAAPVPSCQYAKPFRLNVIFLTVRVGNRRPGI